MPTEKQTDPATLLAWAAEQAVTLLAPLGHRWLHVQGVVAKARQVGAVWNEEDRSSLFAAASLYDMGYAAALQRTGFHPRWWRLLPAIPQPGASGFAGARITPRPRMKPGYAGLAETLAHFPRESSAVADALTSCDSTTNSAGMPVSFEERIADILRRCDEASIVARAILRQAQGALARVLERVQRDDPQDAARQILPP